jgi:hypothetical protein
VLSGRALTYVCEALGSILGSKDLLEVGSQDVGRTMLPLEAPGKDPSLFLLKPSLGPRPKPLDFHLS